MKTRLSCFALGGVMMALTACGPAERGARPNVILIMVDDMGYGDLGVHGNAVIRTPNLDRLAARSVRLTAFHVDPTCSPTRAALLTGRYSTRTGVWHTIRGRSLMRPEEITLAEVFAGAGYRTGMVGKWHLGDNYPLRPQDQGFHETFYHRGGVVGQVGDWFGNHFYDDTYFRDGTPEKTEGYATDVWFDEALGFVERNRSHPFFLYLTPSAAHWPYLVDEAISDPYLEQGVPPTMAKFYGVIERVDENIGRLMDRLEKLGLADDTIIVFMTDNGSAEGAENWRGESGSWAGFNAGMRDGKGSEYEGGHRVPFFIRWPSGGIAGGRVLDGLTAHIDVLPTLAAMCDVPVPETADLDGISLAPMLRSGTEAAGPPRTLFVHSQRVDRPVKWRHSAVMRGPWRLINGAELYDLDNDPGQVQDIAGGHPDVVAELRRAYDAWWAHLSPAFEQTVRIAIGSDDENPAELTSHDWNTDDEQQSVWAARQVFAGHRGNGFFAVNVVTAGRYEIELRRWPRHFGLWIGAAQARLVIGGETLEKTISPYDTRVVFNVDLDAGPTELQSWLGDARGAYFVTVKRL